MDWLLMGQALLNLVLNAVEAMEEGGAGLGRRLDLGEVVGRLEQPQGHTVDTLEPRHPGPLLGVPVVPEDDGVGKREEDVPVESLAQQGGGEGIVECGPRRLEERPLEQVVGRLSLEPTVSAASWSVGPMLE